jgi:hypothetical protein
VRFWIASGGKLKERTVLVNASVIEGIGMIIAIVPDLRGEEKSAKKIA